MTGRFSVADRRPLPLRLKLLATSGTKLTKTAGPQPIGWTLSKRIYFNAFHMNCVVHQSPGLWVHPEDQMHRYKDLSAWVELAQLLERGKFDGLFLADVIGVYDVFRGSRDVAVRGGVQIPVNDPSLLIPAMAHATEHLGFAYTSLGAAESSIHLRAADLDARS